MKTLQRAVSVRGQVVIPKKLRQRLGIHAGTQLDFFEERGRLVAVKSQQSIRERLDKVTGILKTGKSTDEIMEELRGPPYDPAIDGPFPVKKRGHRRR